MLFCRNCYSVQGRMSQQFAMGFEWEGLQEVDVMVFEAWESSQLISLLCTIHDDPPKGSLLMCC